ncbi:MAG: hypothetical protein HW389_1970 [Bacteroidetes bacterium]|nr:hypothetical protein [Bacteroidota bacterium]
MLSSVPRILLTVAAVMAGFAHGNLLAQEIPAEVISKAPKVYLDCRHCDETFLHTAIRFVNYVRDPQLADVHILVAEQTTGSGGTEYSFAFIGRGPFAGRNDTLKHFTQKSISQDVRRRGIARTIEAGLFRFALETPIADFLSIAFRSGTANNVSEDSWNYWVFTMRARAAFDGRKYEGTTDLSGSFSASRTTADWKTRLEIENDFEESSYEYTSENELVSSRFVSRRSNFNGIVVGSLDDHWSAGLTGSAYSSTYDNIKLSIGIRPALEYNVFPYDEATYRELRIQYRIGVSQNRYVDTTIYGKTAEYLGSHSLSCTLDLRQPWGSSSVSVIGSHYFHNADKFRIRFNGRLSVHLYEGLSIDLNGNYSAIRDQIALAQGEATPEEVLTRQRALATNYSFSFSIGIGYTFGSIYNNVVNPRFGDY